MAKEIKQKIVLEGEKEYSEAIRNAQRNLRTLKSALKAETAELGANATAQQKAETKAKSLKKQIAEQEKVVETYRQALAEVKSKYADNEDAIARWETKLNDARTTLANSRSDLERLKNDLGGLSDSMDGVKNATAEGVTATRSLGEALSDIGSVGESVSGAIEGIVSGVMDKLREMASEVWQMISETAAKANNWSDIAGYWGTDAQTIQKWARAVGASANSFEDLQTAITQIAVGGKQKKITELLGISDVNYKTDWDYAIAVLDQIANFSSQGRDMTSIYEEIFGGKKSTKVMDLVNDWNTIREGLETYNGDEGGFGMTSDELQTMNDVWVKINEIQTKWQALKDSFAAGLGTTTMNILVSASGALDALNAFFNAETEQEREQALAEFKTKVEEMFQQVADAIRAGIETLNAVGQELAESDDPIVAGIGKILTSLTESLEWMINNQEAVKAAIEAIFGAWLVGKLAAIAGKLAGIVANIQVVKKFKDWNIPGTDARTPTGSPTTTPTAPTGSGPRAPVVAPTGGGGGAVNVMAPGGKSIGGPIKQFTLNAMAAMLAHEGFKLLPADLMSQAARRMGLGTDADAILDKWNQEHGINTMADVEQKILETPKETNQKAMSALFGALLPGQAAEAQEKAKEPEKEPEVFSPLALTEAQRSAAESYWDAFRGWSNGGDAFALEDAFDALDESFAGQEETLSRLYDLIDGLKGEGSGWLGLEDLPQEWFGGAQNGNQITSSDLQGFNSLPGLMRAAVQAGAASGVSGIQVNLDGARVGQLVAPYVSQRIASDLITR